MTTVKHLQTTRKTGKETPKTETPRNNDGTYRPNSQNTRGNSDPMDLDATRKQAWNRNTKWTPKAKIQEMEPEETAKDGGPQ